MLVQALPLGRPADFPTSGFGNVLKPVPRDRALLDHPGSVASVASVADTC